MKHIIASMALAVGSAWLIPAAAETIISLDKISSHAVFTLTRQATAANGGGLLHYTDATDAIYATPSGKGVTADSPEAQWSIHYSQKEKAYFIYNLGNDRFMGVDKRNHAVFTTAPTDVRPVFHDGPKYWALDCGGSLVGLASDYEGQALFLDDLSRTQARNMACFFTLTAIDGKTISHDRYLEIEQKIAEGRSETLEKYKTFLGQAKQMAESSNANYKICLGNYDYEQLEYALEHAEDYTLSEIDAIYQQTLLSRYPKAGHFYRLHFQERPSKKYMDNACRTTVTGEIVGTEFNKFGYGTATAGFSDDLCLVRFWPQNGDPTRVKIEIPAFGEFLTEAPHNRAPGRTLQPSEATIFNLNTRSNTARTFIIAQPSGTNNWLTMGGDNKLVSWNVKENSMYFYAEMVESIDIPVDANGYASVCLPCGVALPEGCKAYTVTSVAGGKAFVEEIEGPIHQHTPWILKAPQGADKVALPVENNVNWTATEMAGTTRVIEAPGRYVPEYSASGISFKYVAATDPAETVLPGSVYIISDDQGPLTTVMGANPEAGIEEITVGEAAARELFDLQGRKVVDTPRAGLYINAATKRVVRVK